MILGHTEVKVGVLIELDGIPYRVTESTHKALGRGGAVVQAKIKNLITGGVVEKSFRTSDKVSTAEVTRSNMQLLYREGKELVLMNTETYDQINVNEDILGEQAKYVADSSIVQIVEYNNRVIGLEMPNAVILKVSATEPGAKGDTATTALKQATLETGVVVNVPLFINEGDGVKINTLNGNYLERAK
jgi:elongation factor P